MATDHVLVALDHSDCAHLVVDEAVQVAKSRGARMTLLHAIRLPSGVDETTEIVPDRDQAPVEAGPYLRADSRARIDKFKEEAEAQGISVHVRVEEGEPADVILDVAERLKADLIVMGTHGRKGIARFLLGSVAEKVLRRAACPVLSVRFQRRPECEARSCGWCQTHTTDASRKVIAELEG